MFDTFYNPRQKSWNTKRVFPHPPLTMEKRYLFQHWLGGIRDPAQVFQLLLTGIEDIPASTLIYTFNVTADVLIRTSCLGALGKIPGNRYAFPWEAFPIPVILFCFHCPSSYTVEKQGTVRCTPDKWDILCYYMTSLEVNSCVLIGSFFVGISPCGPFPWKRS